MPLLPEGIDAIRSEEATLDLLAREYHSPPLTETLFGRQANECVIRAIEAADIFDLDSLLIQGVISTKEMYAFATASEEFQECCRSLYAAATDAAAHFDNGKRLQYTFGKFFDRNGAPKTLALAELFSEVNRSMSHIGLEKEIPFVTMRLYLLSLFRLRLWSELIHRFHTYAAESQTRLLQWSRMVGSLNRISFQDKGGEDDELGALFRRSVRAVWNTLYYKDRLQGLPEHIPQSMSHPIDELAALSLEKQLPASRFPAGLMTVETCELGDAREMVTTEAIAEFYLHFPPTGPGLEKIAVMGYLSRATGELFIAPGSLPLKELWPELSENLLPYLTTRLHALFVEAPVSPLQPETLPQRSVYPAQAAPDDTGFDWKAYRAEQLRIREAIVATVPEGSFTADAPTTPGMRSIPAVESASAARAFTKLLGQAVRIAGSHHVFEGRTGERCPLPVHQGRAVGIGLLKKCLKVYGLSMDEFLSAL